MGAFCFDEPRCGAGLRVKRPVARRGELRCSTGDEWGFWERWDTEDRIVAAWVQWLRRLGPFSVWATLTYRVDGVSMACARRHPFEFARAAARIAKRHVIVVAAGEPQRLGRPHWHALLLCPDGPELEVGTAAHAWRDAVGVVAGNVKAERPHGFTPEYLCRHPNRTIEVGCPRANRCRRPHRGCMVSRALRGFFAAE